MAHIGIIGSGNIGAALAQLFTRAGHAVAISNSRGPASLAALAAATGARAATVQEVVAGSDIVVVAVPMVGVPTLPADLFQQAPRGQIVIDTSNYYPRHRDGLIAEVEAGMLESAWVARHLGVPVIKAFNTIRAPQLLARSAPNGTSGRVALAVAGDDASARKKVMQLVEDIGFDSVDAGEIGQSWRQQPGSPGYLKDLDAAGVRRTLAEAREQRLPEWKATAASPGTLDIPA